MAIAKLIDHQRIQIDNHSAGGREPTSLDGWHIHKTFIGSSRKGKYVKIGLDGENIQTNLDGDDRTRVMSEIRSVLKKDKQKLREFGMDVAKSMHRWSNGTITRELAAEHAKTIADKLGLKPTIKEEIVRTVGDVIAEYLSIHDGPDHQPYWLRFSRDSFSAGPGTARLMRGWAY